MVAPTLPDFPFVVIRKNELDSLVRELDRIGKLLDILLAAQGPRRDLLELLPYDFAEQSFLRKQRDLPPKGGRS